MPGVLRERGSMRVGGRLIIAGGCVVVSALVTLALYESAPPAEPKPEAGSNPAVASVLPPRSILWLLAIGVSRYNASELNLQFADVDARAIAEHLTRSGHSGIYRNVQKMVLTNEEVTRESILNSLTSFLGQAGPDDVAVLFVAGHGVRDLASGSYYFLPHPATGENLLSEGLRVSDFDEMLRLVRRNVRAMVVMLDTCHAGSLGIPSARIVATDKMAAQMSAGQDFFLLAATKPGEESKENQELGHGAFTYALLEALRGAADSDGDSGVSVSELFGYVARRVPNLTQGQQHPYHKTEGTDLVLLSVSGEVPTPLPPRTIATPIPTATPDPAAFNIIGVMEFQNLRADTEYEWISKALRVAFNTELSKVHALRVYSPELIDRATRRRGADTLYTARELGRATAHWCVPRYWEHPADRRADCRRDHRRE